MRHIFMTAAVMAMAFVAVAEAQVHVRGYHRSDGTYVKPHYRSSPDSNPYNNYSTRGNVNPYTGQAGTVNPNGGSGYRSGFGGSNFNVNPSSGHRNGWR